LIILSLDQATKVGWSLFEDDKLIDCGLEDFSNIEFFAEKVNEIKKWYEKKIIETKAEIFALEDVQYQKNARVHKELSQLLGVLENYLIEKQYFYQVIPNKEWKSTCGIKGKKRKEQKANAQKFCKNKFGIEVEEDIADAICIGWHMSKKILPKIKIEKYKED